MSTFMRGARKHTRSFCTILCVFASLIGAGCASSGGGNGFTGGPGVDTSAKTITLGILTPLTGQVAAPIGIPLTKGIETYFDGVNATGGIDGYQIKLVEKDTQYSPQLEVQQYNAIKNQVAMFGESLGTPTTQAIVNLANSDHVLVSAATLDSYLARETYTILIGTPYRLQVENAFDYLVKKVGVQNPKVGIIYQDDGYGQDGLKGYQESVGCYSLTDVAQATYELTDTSFVSQVTKMKQAGAQYVVLTAIPTIAAGIIGAGAAIGYFPRWILQSPAWANGLLAVSPQFTGLLKQTVWVVAQGATWGDTTVPAMVKMLSDLNKYDPTQQPDGFFEFGYAEALVTGAILKKAADNHDLSRAGLFNAFNSLGTVNLGGLFGATVTYGSSPNQRVPTRDNSVYGLDTTIPNNFKDLSGDFTGTCAANSQF
jgi:ABC-type branched-subunit amino acid transport system substrate-binding protein